MIKTISLVCGYPPFCDRCCENDAKVILHLPKYGQRLLCENCINYLVELGLETNTKKIVSNNEIGGPNDYAYGM